MIKIIIFLIPFVSFALTPDQKRLPRGLAQGESPVTLRAEAVPKTKPPVAPVIALGEWEESEGVITLWPNASYFHALTQRTRVKILSSEGDKAWWRQWLKSNRIDSAKIDFITAETDSIWVRDYGPWWVVDGTGTLGAVDTIYNRPRPQDDMIPEVLAKEFNFPLFDIGVVHTGGNFYSDGFSSAFSSTLVHKENSRLATRELNQRMRDYLGIDNYLTSPLGEDVTIEHLDTFGKLVSPDTWVFSEFPKSSTFHEDSERMVQLLKARKSPYGTPYKIFRMPMVLRPSADSNEDYRAYINSFISNRVLYYPIYGDEHDVKTRSIYQQALPGYEIVGVDADGTEWGDSVHCRSRNFMKRKAIFVFPRLSASGLEIISQIVPSPGAKVVHAEVILRGGGLENVTPMRAHATGSYVAPMRANLVGPSEFAVRVRDSAGVERIFPDTWPEAGILLQ